MTINYKKLTFCNISAIAMCLLLLFGCKKNKQYDLVLKDANYYNVERGSFEKANIAVEQGKIVAISETPLVGENEINLEGKFLYPGFIDAHAHFVGYANGLWNVNLVGTTSFEEVVRRIEQFVLEHPDLKFIIGRGWDQNDWQVKAFPNNDTLNLLYPNLPIVLERIDGHASLVNQAALDLIGELPEYVKGGSIVRMNGQPTGLLIDEAVELIPQPKISARDLSEHLDLAQKNCFAMGLTGLADAGLDKGTILLLDSLQKAGRLKMPIYAMIKNDSAAYNWFFEQGKIKTELLHVNSIKVYGDGALGSRGALLLEPYADDQQNFGLTLTSAHELLDICRKADANGFQVNVHGIGDSANRTVVKTFAQVLEPDNDKRWRVEHAQVVNPSDSTYWKAFNIIPSVQPTHATSDMYWAEQRLGPERVKTAYSFKSLLNWNGKIALGTDFPVEDIDPRKTLYAAVTRQDASGYPKDGFLPTERLSRVEAILGMTLWAAYAQFEENEKGSIEVGKWADFIISETNLLTCEPEQMLNMPIERTIVHGETVYQKIE